MSVGHHQPLLLSISEDSENQINHQPHQPHPGSSASARYCVKEAWTECKKLWQIAAPSIFCRLAMFSLTLITQSFAGHLDQRHLAAISIATTVIISITFGFLFTLMRFLQCQLKTYVVAWVSGVVLVVHLLLSWIFVYRLRVGIVGAALTLDFSWWMSVLGMFIYCVCGGCRNSWTGLSRQAFIGLWDFFKLALASGVMLSLENFYYRILVIVSGIRNAEVAVDALSICISFYGWESMIPLGLFAATG
ncbi:UNVERIFIED_CONTAM: protein DETOXIFICATION 27, partial [Sesamum latifolium]